MKFSPVVHNFNRNNCLGVNMLYFKNEAIYEVNPIAEVHRLEKILHLAHHQHQLDAT